MADSRSYSLLAPRIQHWIWNQGWSSLLEIQENTIPLVLRGDCDIVVSAPTGGGKTEAVFLPILTRMIHNPLNVGYYVLYISPLKALINDQTRRLTDICNGVGVNVTPWHGDISNTKKANSFSHPNGILIITPESLESMFMHKGDMLKNAFASLRYIVIDEIHSFVGKERGKQVQSLMGRIEFVVGHPVARIGMSATLSDYEDIKRYIRPEKSVRCEVPDAGNVQHEIKVLIKEFLTSDDEVMPYGISIDIFEKLRGTNNLVFTQSRAGAEKLISCLSDLSQQLYVPNEFRIHHSSIAKEDRQNLEAMLQAGRIPVTAVCTSTLELGIDVGTVKSVAQIGPCPSVSSLRQRLGRSGRRNAPSILRIYNSDSSKEENLIDCMSFGLIQSIALIELILEKKYEPYNLEKYHFSTLIQQILSVLSQYGSFYPKEGWLLLCKKGAFENVTSDMYLDLLRELKKADIISQTNSGQIVIGVKGERLISKTDFYTAFVSYPVVHVIQKSTGKEVGSIDGNLPVGSYFILSGKYWIVLESDESGARIFAEQVPVRGETAFGGSMIDIDRIIIEKMRQIYLSQEEYPYLDSTAKDRLELARGAFNKLNLGTTNYITIEDHNDDGEVFQQHLYFTWAGSRINRTICLASKQLGLNDCGPESIFINGISIEALKRIKENECFDECVLASLMPRYQKEKEKYDKLIPDRLLDMEYAKGYLDVLGMMEFLKTSDIK